jgi:hypothetical protein
MFNWFLEAKEVCKQYGKKSVSIICSRCLEKTRDVQ